ncbi:T9SS type A sorting domain-containing protein [Psychroserpens sp. Hel_I_66]|uniref:T9SS type A sorting domain-containing protein n=1 Tax=Psychroserpens sp. Hel_I_66 TaxID=1250004 RepID=UPI000648F50A|nr:T9SS type A sorting domain-containing protein [Psychroserpens sp. Hel_I_66]
MKHLYTLLLFILIGNFGFGQVIDDNFEDGNLDGWGQGSAFNWIVSDANPITGIRSMKHNLNNTAGSSYIGFNTSALDITTQDTSWQFNLQNGDWDPSGGNKFWVYLTANEFNINSNAVDGYAVGVNFSGTSDLITLWKVTNGSVDEAIVTSSINWNANETIGIRVERTAMGNWELFVDTNGGFDNLVSEGTGVNNDYTFNNFFGLSFTFSSTRAGLLWMDDVLVQNEAPASTETPDFCNLQFPGSATITQGSTFTAFARVFEPGVTPGDGAGATITAEFGISAVDANNVSDFSSSDWTWTTAPYFGEAGNDDEYSDALGATLTPGNYFYVSRFSVDGGPFVYGGIDATDGDGGNFWDGSSFVSGELTVEVQIPTTVATFNINGCGDSDTYNAAYDANTQAVIWIELIYDGNCSEITLDTELTTGIDTEIGLYSAFGNLISNDDDGGTDTLSLLTEQNLPAGTYYIAAGGFDTAFGNTEFNVTSTNTTNTGTLYINASTPNIVDFCNLQSPGSGTITQGNPFDVFAQVFENGVTNPAGQGANIQAWIGVSETNAETITDFESLDWTWIPASYNTDIGNNDEYQAEIGSEREIGNYFYVSRFSIDNGPFSYGGIDVTDGDGGNFWDGNDFVSGQLTVNPKPEPTNHVLNFSAVADSNTAVTLTWNDNDGTQAADGFLIVGKTATGAYFTPVDGTEPADDTDFSDNDFEVNVSSGIETYTVTGLISSTQYDFQIYPYTNTGTDVDFKTDGTIPEVSATTLDGPVVIAIQDFETTPQTPVFNFNNTNGTFSTGTGPVPNDNNFVSGIRGWEANNQTSTLTFESINVSNYENIRLDFRLASFSGTSGNGSDGPDNVLVEVSTDNGATYSNEIEINGNNNARWSFDTGTGLATTIYDGDNNQTNFAPSSGGNITTEGLSFISITDLPNSSELVIRVSMANNSSNEYWIIDDVILTGTLLPVTDTDSQAYDSGSQPEAAFISSLVDTEFEAVEVFDIDLEDLGTSDGLDTQVTKIRLFPHTTNTADWTDNIQGLTVADNSDEITITSLNITDAFIDVNFGIGDLTIADGTNKPITFSVYLNTSNIADGEILSFAVDADNNGFETDSSGSAFSSDFLLGDFNSNDFTIDVETSEIIFAQQPTNTLFNVAMSPPVTVIGTDENGNVDLDYDLDVSITSTGTLDTSPITVTAVSGVATFNNIVHTAAGTGLTLTASDGLFTDIISDPFDISAIETIVFQSFGVDGGDWNYTTEPETYNINDDTWDVVDASFITFSNMPSEGVEFFGIRDLTNDNGGVATVSTDNDIIFETIEVDNYENIEISFDYQVEGFDNADNISYELFEDGISLGREIFVDGELAGTIDGSITISITDGVDEIGLIIHARQNGGDDYAGLDNFKITGSIRAITNYVFDESNGGWSPANPSGISNSNDNITILNGDASDDIENIGADTRINNVSISTGSKLVIDKSASLIMAGTLDNAGELTVLSDSNEFGSLIANTVNNTGNLIYLRYTNGYTGDGGNDLISAPFTGDTFGNFANYQLNIDNLYSNPSNTDVKLFGPFDKATGSYLTFDITVDAGEVIREAVGYRAATENTNLLEFRGEMNTGVVPTEIVRTETNFPEWNLIGNPYPSYITLSDFLAENSSKFDSNSSGVYGYTNTSTTFTIWNQAYSDANPDALIAPGQGFLVAAGSASEIVNFTPVMRSRGNTDDFIAGRSSNSINTTNASGNNLGYLKLQATTSSNSYSTSFYFNTNASQGLDNGYDSSEFGDVAPSNFAIYSHLVQDNEGKDFAIQSLGSTDLTNVIVPIGINAEEGQQITVSILENSLPSNTKVFLDDTVENISTLLNTTDYNFTANTTLEGTGRFFLRYTEDALSTPENNLNTLEVYTTANPKAIFVKGEITKGSMINLYDIQGRAIFSSELDSTKISNQIDVSSIASGIYIVEINSNNASHSEKVILK